MTNTEIISTIRSEIERRINELDISDESILIEAELSEILSFIDTLESEKPEVDLEKEIEISIRLLNGLHTLEDNKSWYKGRYEELKELARHFYDLGRRRTAERYDEIEYNRQRAEEHVSEGLEEEIIKCWQEWISPSNKQSVEGVLPLSEFAFYARHFAKWGEHNAMENLRATRRTEEAYQEVVKEMRKQIKDGEELEEEMDKFFETMPVLEHENIFEETFKNIARHFAQWGAEHLNK